MQLTASLCFAFCLRVLLKAAAQICTDWLTNSDNKMLDLKMLNLRKPQAIATIA